MSYAPKANSTGIRGDNPRPTTTEVIPVEIQNHLLNAASIDAANRMRVSQQITLGDYRQTNDNLPYFFDEFVEGTATATYEQSKGGVNMAVANDGDYAIRQTFQTHNYSAGKSQLIEITFTDMAPQTDVLKRQGYYESDFNEPFDAGLDGFMIESSNGEVRFRVVKNDVDKLNVSQSNWNQDTFDGNGPSGVNINWNNFNVLVIDFLYLGGTSVRFGFIINGAIQWAHIFNHSNNFNETIVTRPSLPIRAEIRSEGGAGSMYQICSQVSSEGVVAEAGRVRGFDMGTTNVDANTIGTMYPLIGIRLKSTYRDVSISPVSYNAISTTNDNFLLRLVINPTLSATPTWVSGGDGAVEISTQSGSSLTATDGNVISSKYGLQNNVVDGVEESARRIGQGIDGTPDEMWLCAIPLSTNLDILGTLKIRELI